MEVAKIQVGGTCACAYEKKTIRAGMVGVTVSFAFDEYWVGLNKIAVYRCGGVVRDEYLEGDTGTIPAEVLTKSGFDLEIGVYGTDAEKQIAIPTCWANLGVVRPGADPSGDPAADPELPFWAKVQEWIKTRFVKTINGIAADENGNVKIETGKVEVDPTLTKEGFAADAKAVGEELGKKALKTLYVEPTDIDGDSKGQSTMFPVKIANHTAEEIKAWFQNGGNVKLSYWGQVLDLKGCEFAYANFESTSYDNTGGGGTQLVISRATIHPDGSIFVYYPESLGYVRSNFSAKVGQTIVVDAVDEHDIPTAWKAVDMASGGASGAMYVTVSNGTAGISKDRTFAEMKSHYDNGNRVVVLYYEQMSGSSTKYIFEIYSVDDSKMQFSRTRVFNMYDDLYRVDTEIITIQSDETVSKSTVTYQHKHNIDAELSDSSDNAVQNKVVTAALAQKSQVQIIRWEEGD